MALRELVTVLRYELQEGQLKKYVDGYRRAEKTINQVAQAASSKLNGALKETVRTTGQMERGANRVAAAMARVVREAREFGIGLQQGARRGYGEVIRQLDRVEARQRRLRRSGGVGAVGEGVGFLSGAIQGVLATVSGKAFMDAADSWSTTKGQIALQNESPVDRARTREYLFGRAQEQGQDYATSVGTYTRIARNRQVLGLSNDEVLQMTGALGGMLALGGGSASSQQAALEQFGQAMSSGVLRGEELNSVLEQAPVLANAISKAFGITSDQLRNIAQEGRLTSKEIARGLLGQANEVDAAMKSLPMTFRRSITQIRNQFTRLAGELSEKYRLAERFNVAAQWVMRNMGKIGATLAVIASSFVAVRVIRYLAIALTSLRNVGRPLLLFFDRLARGKWAQAFAKFGPAGLRFLRILRWIGTALAGISAVGVGVFAAIAAALIAVGLLIYKYWEPIKAWFLGVFDGIWRAAKPALDEIGSALGALRPAWDAVATAIGNVWDWFVRLISPVDMTSEQLRGATEAGRKFGIVLGLVLANGLRGFAAMIRAIGWVISQLGAMSKVVARIPVLGTYAQMASMLMGGPAGAGNWTNVGAGQMATAGRPVSSNQTINNNASVSVMAPSSNPAAVGAAAQRGTRQAMSSFNYQLPTSVEAH